MMTLFTNQSSKQGRPFFAASVIVLIVSFIGSSLYMPQAYANDLPSMPTPGMIVHLSPEFTPALLKGIVIHPENAFKFDFIVYKGDKILIDSEKKEEYTKLIKYFLASLAIPDEDQWVNLSPYEKDRIIKDDFGKTEMGRDLLAQDYLLKQMTASLIYPQEKLGQKFWDEVYDRAYKKFGTTQIPVNTFNKVWIVPDEADIYEKGNVAYLYKNHLKVMLEEDYLSLKKHAGITSIPAEPNDFHTIGSQVVREIILPALEKEVNENKNFAPVRQVFNGMILAAWFKRALRTSFIGKIYANKTKVKGIDQDPANNEAIYKQYLKAYKKGVFNYIKDDIDKYTNEKIPRKYFSGGATAPVVIDDRGQVALDSETGLAKLTNAYHVGSGDVDRQKEESDVDSGIENGTGFDEAAVSLDPRNGTADNAMDTDEVKNVVSRFLGSVTYLKRNGLTVEVIPNYTKKGEVAILIHQKMKEGHEARLPRISGRMNELERSLDLPKEGLQRRASISGLLIFTFDDLAMMGGKVSYEDDAAMNVFADMMDKPYVYIPVYTAYQRALVELGADSRLAVQIKVFFKSLQNGLVDGSNIPTRVALDSILEAIDHKDIYLNNKVLKYVLMQATLFLINHRDWSNEYEGKNISNRALLEKFMTIFYPIYSEYDYLAKREKLKELVRRVRKELDAESEPAVAKKSLEFGFGLFKRNRAQQQDENLSPLLYESQRLKAAIESFPDRASTTNSNNDLGGIDMNAANLRMYIKRDGRGVPLPVGQQDLAQIHIDGLVPVILEIRPASSSFILSQSNMPNPV